MKVMRSIHPLIILRILSSIMLIEAISFLVCLPVALIYMEPLQPFLLSSLIIGVLVLLLRFITRKTDTRQISNRDTYIIVSIAWIIFSTAGILPYVLSGTIPSFIDALFESASGFTTTGASILREVEWLPYSILFWRSLTHWIGGIGIIVLVILVLPSLKVTGYQLFSLESSMKERIHPKTRGIVSRILFIYLGLTVLQIFFLVLGDMNLFDSICTSFGTVATGGFSTKNLSLSEYSAYVQFVTAIFMILGATSYVVYYYTLVGNYRKVIKNEEFWFYIFFVIASVVIVTLILYFKSDRNFELSFRHAFFQVASQISCSGFATTDYTAFPSMAVFIMFLLMFSGGCTGSTTGGIKMARHLISFKNLRNTFIKIQHPNAITPVKLNGRMVSEGVVNQVTVFITLYIFVFLAGSLIMQVTGISVLESAGASATCLANIGPGFGDSGNMGNFAHFNGASKVIMCFLMVLGRLELFTFLTIFTKSFRRN